MLISNINRQTVKRILLLLKPYTKKVIVIMVCTLLLAVIRVIYPLISKQLIDKGFMTLNYLMVVKSTITILLLVLIEQGIALVGTKYQIYINSMFSFMLAKSALKKLFRLKLHFFNNTKIGEIINNINTDVQTTSAISSERIFSAITSVFSIAGGLTGLAIINWKLTVLAILLIPSQFVLIMYISKKKRGLFEFNMEKYKLFWGWYSDIIGGAREIKLWSIRTIMTGMFVKKQRDLIKSNVKMAYLDKACQIFDNVISNMIISILYLVGAAMILKGSLTLGGLFAFISYVNFVTLPFFYLVGIGGYIFSTILPSAQRLFKFFDLEGEGSLQGQKRIRIDVKNVYGNISFENVSYSYEKEKILDSVSFEIKKGEKIAITGANGSGKTTIINLILRFLMPDSGRILLDGTDINSISLKDYRDCISVICQDIYLFDANIKDNITLFRKMDDSIVFNAASQSTADEFVSKMSDKYETAIGRNGSQISGGEKQKIAVARAFAKKAPILIMDEATSNLDIQSEMLVNRILNNEFSDVTVIIVTHKPNILKKVNKVLTLKKGKLTVHN